MDLKNYPITIKAKPYLLKNKIQPYAWGMRGKDAFIPRLLGIEAQPGEPYAELWLGTHPNAPSEVDLEGTYVPLSQLISQYPLKLLGESVARKFDNRLPFLFKVLSAGQALSIQAHPDKPQAETLHALDPEHYPDDNHKPEIAIALDSLTALVGFKPFDDILQTLKKYPELTDFIGIEVAGAFKKTGKPDYPEQRNLVKKMYSTLMKRSAQQQEMARSLDQLENRLITTATPLSEEEQLFIDLKKVYGVDVGLFSIFLFNLMHLTEGQAIFLEAGLPHAYIRGNIIECMANSDNVVRAGLTPKFKDVETLVNILTYKTTPVPILAVNPATEQIVYQTPALEFQVMRRKMSANCEIQQFTGNQPEIMIVTEGNVEIQWGAKSTKEQKQLSRGQSVFIPAILNEYSLVAKTPAVVFKAQVP